jgi:hypothetical protein
VITTIVTWITQEEDRDEDYEIEIPIHYKKRSENQLSESPSQTKKAKIRQQSLNSPDVVSALDRINMSDRKFTILAAAIARANGDNLDSSPLSRSTVYRKRSVYRSLIESSIREEFRTTEKPPLVIHWDGKLMKDSTNIPT